MAPQFEEDDSQGKDGSSGQLEIGVAAVKPELGTSVVAGELGKGGK